MCAGFGVRWDDVPKLPSLGDFGRRDKSPASSLPVLPTPAARRTSFQRRPSIARRRGGGTAQPSYGDPLELRAAQDAIGTIEFRIVLQELRRRLLVFDYADNLTGQGVPVSGFTVDFLISSVLPNLALDIVQGKEREERGIPERLAYKAAALESSNARYGVLYGADIRQSSERLELLLDDLLGQSVPTGALSASGYTESGIVVSFDLPPDPGGEMVALPPSLGALDVATLTRLLQQHHQQHALDGADAIQQVRSAEYLSLLAKNNSGAMVPRGSAIKLDTSITTYRSFTTSTTIDDHRVGGVTLEDIPNTGFGRICIEGYVREVRVAAGTTIYQYLRQSSTAGVWEGTSEPTPGTCAIAVSDRNATLGTCEAFVMHMHGATTVYDSITSAAITTSFWDDFTGLIATVNSTTRYSQTVSGATVPTFAVDATTGKTVLDDVGVGVDTADDACTVYFKTFTPRAAEDWGFKIALSELTAPVTGGASRLFYYVGFVLDSATFTSNHGTKGCIAFVSTDSGNWLLTCRATSGGAATTVSMGVGPDTTKRLLEFRITGGGTSVQGYVDNVLTGAAITTNIPSGLVTQVGIFVYCGTTITSAGELNVAGLGVQDGY